MSVVAQDDVAGELPEQVGPRAQRLQGIQRFAAELLGPALGVLEPGQLGFERGFGCAFMGTAPRSFLALVQSP